MAKLRDEALADSDTREKNAKLKQRVKELESLVEQQAQQIEGYRNTKYRFPVGTAQGVKGKTFCRMVIPDTHGSVVDVDAIKAFLADLEIVKPAEIIMLGDHLECGGFLAEHHTLGYVAQSEYSFADDCVATNSMLDSIAKLAPKARVDYLEGNHERRIETWICTQVRKSQKDGYFLRQMFSADSVLSIEKRGIRWIRQGVFYDDLPLPATIKRGHCYFTHGSSTAKHAAAEHVKKFGGNVVYGHTHRADSYVIRTVKEGSIGAWNPGCLCQLQPLWQHTNPTDWTHGYGLQLVSSDGSFLHINVPIIAGKSYLQPLIKAIA